MNTMNPCVCCGELRPDNAAKYCTECANITKKILVRTRLEIKKKQIALYTHAYNAERYERNKEAIKKKQKEYARKQRAIKKVAKT